MASTFHLIGWRTVIKRAYSYPTHYLMAILIDDKNFAEPAVQGVLPLVHMRSLAFGNHLISIPFFDNAGILWTTPEAGRVLISEGLRLGRKLGARSIELRQGQPIDKPVWAEPDHIIQTSSEKVRMVLNLSSSSEELMRSFKSKLRSQVKNPIKKGLQTRIGGIELLKDFYRVFSENMRDLGSPVHSAKLMAAVLQIFKGKARIFVIHQGRQPLAASLVIGFNETLCNPWASSLRRYKSLNANMLLYWRMLEYACDRGFRRFDFGRSSPEEGTFKFKQQWGANPVPLAWYTLPLVRNRANASPNKNSYEPLIRMWQRLPVALTKIIGPPIRKRINL